MTDQDTSNQDVEDADAEEDRHAHSRRSLLAAMGAGAAGLALGGLTDTASANEESSAAEEFIDSTSAATTATSDGDWSDSAVWDNGVPTAEQTVRIDSGVTLTVDTTTADIMNLDVAGTLEFATDTDSHLRAETIVTRPDSTMQIGTESSPIQQGSEARITIVHHEDISEKDDPNRISKGIITMGEFTVHGAEKTSWDELASAPEAGDTSIELASAPTNWNEGDEIVIPGLNPSSNEDEERTIASVSGATVELDEPLEYDHAPPENSLDVALTAHALNRTRNVLFESEIKETDVTEEARINRQGHLMITKPAQSISYLEVDHFGRTNKNFWMDEQDYSGDNFHGHGTEEPSEPNIVARYGLHFHKTGIGEDPHEVTGVAVKHSPGWGVVNHSSHANVRDSITYDIFGAGFVAESGKERGAFERCFALRSEGSENVESLYSGFDTSLSTPSSAITSHEVDFGHEGEGFWLQSPAVAVDDCVAAGHDGYAFALWAEPLDGNMPTELAREDGIADSEAPASHRCDFDPYDGVFCAPDGGPSPHYLPLKSFSNNTAFASAGGFDYGFCKPTGTWSSPPHSVVETFTVYNIGPRLGTYPSDRVYTFGDYGNCCIASRYSRNLKVVNPQFCNVDGEDGGHGIRRNAWARESIGVYGGVMEGLNVGVQVNLHFRPRNGPHTDGEDIDDVSFYNNNNNDIVFDDPGFTSTDHVGNGADSWGDMTVHTGTKVGIGIDTADVTSQPEAADWDGNSATHNVPGDYEFSWLDIPATMTVTEEAPEGQGPTAAFDYQSTDTASEPVSFDASLSTPSDSITSYEWDFGDGTTATGRTVEHSYDTGGFYDVTLTVTDDAGQTHETTRELELGELHEIVINGLDDQSSDYELSVSGTIERGGNASRVDSIGSDTVSATIGGHEDNYHFGGEVTSWFLEEDIPLEITIDGEEVDPSTLGQSDDGGDSDADETVTVAPGGTHEFSPADLTVEPGTTVAFNWDASGHTVTVDSQPADADWSGVESTQSEGHTLTHTFDVEGTYEYYCRPHQSQMQGTITVTDDEGQSAYGRDSPWPVPGRIQAEDFDSGGSGVAYSDADEQSRGDAGYRDAGVDIQARDGDGYNISNMEAGEWLEYTIEVEEAGSYDITANLASDHGGMDGELAYKLDGTSLASATVTGTGGWNNYRTVTVEGVELSAGEYVLGVHVADTDGHTYGYDLDWIELTQSEGSSGDPDADRSVTVAPDGNHEFSPADLTVEPGTTVAFEWDAGGHTVTVDSQPDDAAWSGVDSTQSEGHEHSHTFDVEGTYEYYCRLHQSHMQGSITVDGSESISEAIDADDDGEMDNDEILDAVEHWEDEEPVPGTGGETISDQQILDFVDSWEDGGSE